MKDSKQKKRVDTFTYPIDLEYDCIWICYIGYSRKKDDHYDPYITIEELKEKKDKGLTLVNKMLEIIEEYEHR